MPIGANIMPIKANKKREIKEFFNGVFFFLIFQRI